MRLFSSLLVSLAAACGGGSSGPPPAVAGSYTVDVTNTSLNGCDFADWTQGSSSTDIPVLVTQNGAQVTATVTGVVGAAMQLTVGTSSFSGSLMGAQATLNAAGSRPGMQGNCTFTTNATIVAVFSGDTLQGSVTYSRATNGQSDCASFAGCQNVQSLSGVRPPSSD